MIASLEGSMDLQEVILLALLYDTGQAIVKSATQVAEFHSCYDQ